MIIGMLKIYFKWLDSRFLVSLVLLFFLFVSFYFGVFFRLQPPGYISIDYSLIYRVSVKNPTNQSMRINDLAVRLPLGASYLYGADKDSNRYFLKYSEYFEVPPFILPPYAQQRRLVTVEGQQAYPQMAEDLNMKLKRSAGGSNASYQGLVIENTQTGISQLFDWLEQRIEKVPYMHKALTLQELQAVWRGDCPEFTLMGYYALISSGFKNVVPVVWFYFPEGSNRIVDQNKYHAWLLVEDNGQWFVVDPLFKKIQKPNAEYIVSDLMQEGQNEMMILSSFAGIRLE